jgi:serine/arginine repetitive matrix protein 2
VCPPSRTNRPRSSTCTSVSSGADTPPLSISDDYSSISEGSQSNIDLSQVNYMLSNVTRPLSNDTLDSVRPRTRGHGQPQGMSQSCASQTSIYETIEEELTTSVSPTSSPQSIPCPTRKTIQLPNSPTQTNACAPVYIVNPESTPGFGIIVV